MTEKTEILQQIECMGEELGLPLDHAEKKEIFETCREWEMRAERLDRKMSQLPYASLTPANIFAHL